MERLKINSRDIGKAIQLSQIELANLKLERREAGLEAKNSDDISLYTQYKRLYHREKMVLRVLNKAKSEGLGPDGNVKLVDEFNFGKPGRNNVHKAETMGWAMYPLIDEALHIEKVLRYDYSMAMVEIIICVKPRGLQ